MNPETATRADWSIINPCLVPSPLQCSRGKGTKNERASHPSHLQSSCASAEPPQAVGLFSLHVFSCSSEGFPTPSSALLPRSPPLYTPGTAESEGKGSLQGNPRSGLDFATHLFSNSSWPCAHGSDRTRLGQKGRVYQPAPKLHPP